MDRVRNRVERDLAYIERMPWPTVVRLALCLATTVLLITLVVIAFVPRPFGFQGSTVMSGSMEPLISVGSLVLVSEIDTDELRPGQVISFVNPADPEERLLHRILQINDDGTFVTKGDANSSADSTPVPPENVIGLGRILVPWIGLPVVWIQAGDWPSVLIAAAFLIFLVRGSFPAPLIPRGQAGTRTVAEGLVAVVVLASGGYLVVMRGGGTEMSEFTAAAEASGAIGTGEWDSGGGGDCGVHWDFYGYQGAGGTATVYNHSDFEIVYPWQLSWTFTADQIAAASPNGGTVEQSGASVVYTSADWMGPVPANGTAYIQTLNITGGGEYDDPEDTWAMAVPNDFALNGTACETVP
ncbi:signal peptidase I [Glycomyces luteolus]|uniref:Signal peptidase I n=1 Tax=Glycomyces luteolus TaxID=2670330 RepID=A0A9X3SRN1_9ACTN|nr:signal peptidase I [Glycomyces luteolus]MDA1361812.1 signal peptidase I [Glycomyces luteolus]